MIALWLGLTLAQAGWVPVGDSVVAERGQAGVDSGVGHGLGPGGGSVEVVFDRAGEPVVGWLAGPGDVQVRAFDGHAWQVRFDAATQTPSAATLEIVQLVLSTDGTPSAVVLGPQAELGWADLDPFRASLFLPGVRQFAHHGEEAGIDPAGALIPHVDPALGKLALAIPASRRHRPEPLVVWVSTPAGWAPCQGPELAATSATAAWTPAGLRVVAAAGSDDAPVAQVHTWTPADGWGELPPLPLDAGTPVLHGAPGGPRLLATAADGAPTVLQTGAVPRIWRLLGPGWASVPAPEATFDTGSVGADGVLRIVAYVPDHRSVQVLERRGDGWTPLGGALPIGPRGPVQILLDHDPHDRPVVAWADPDGVRLRRFEGGAWRGLGATKVGLGLSGRPQRPDALSLAVTSAGRPVLAWRELAPNVSTLHLAAWDGARWLLDRIEGQRVFRPRALVDDADQPIVGYATPQGERFLRRGAAGWTTWAEHPTATGISPEMDGGWLGARGEPVVHVWRGPRGLLHRVGDAWVELAPEPAAPRVEVTVGVDGTPWALWLAEGGRHVGWWDGASWVELPAAGDEACLQDRGSDGFVVDGRGHPALAKPPCVHDGSTWRVLPVPVGAPRGGLGVQLVGGGRRLVGTWVSDTGDGPQVRVAAWDGRAWRSLDDDPWAEVSRCPGGCGPAVVAARGRHVCAAWPQPSVDGDALALKCAELP